MNDNVVKLIVNDKEILHYDRNIQLPDNQIKYLARMDTQMDNGIELGTQKIETPDKIQKAQFVTFNLLSFLDKDQQQEAIAMFSYIVSSLDKLKQLKVVDDTSTSKNKYKIEFVFYKDLTNWDVVKFH